MAADWSKSGVREVCEEISRGAIEEAMGIMSGMVGNAGQLAIVEGSLGASVSDCFSDVANGNTVELSCNHPDAVMKIMEEGTEVLNAAAERCATIREAARGHDGDAS